MDDRRHRPFGARRQHSSRIQDPGSRGSSSGSQYTSNTLEFDRVAAARHPRPSWTDDGINYDFGGQEEGPHAQNHRLEGPHAQEYRQEGPHAQEYSRQEGPRAPKYLSTRPKASGQSISAPGSSIVSHTGINDGVLKQKFLPPMEQSSFLNGITKKNTNANRGPGDTKQKMARAGSLEAASAPAPKTNVSNLPLGTSGWKSTRNPVPAPKPRTTLACTEKRMRLADERPRKRTPPPVTRTYALRERTPNKLYNEPRRANLPFTLRGAHSTRLGKRKMNSEGSESKPITLDSDSESDVEVKPGSPASPKMSIVDEVLSDNRKRTPKKEQEEEKAAAVDLEDLELRATVRSSNCDVMIGLFQCVVDLFLLDDRLCLRNIRGKHDKWPFKTYYLFDFNRLQGVRHYNSSKEAADSREELEADEVDRMDQLLDEASFVALKLPFADDSDQAAMKSFYDPEDSDASKGYMIIRPLEDASGDGLDDVVDVLEEAYESAQTIDKEQAKQHLQALMKDPFTYLARRRSQRRKSTRPDEESPSESEADDVDGNVTVLTYPLPPCTSDIVTIIRHDVARLKPRRYLNDNIIDYYFKRLMVETFRDNAVVQEKVLFLSSHFYSRLRAGKGATVRARMEAGYKNVSTWLTRSNFFNRSIIFIPINKDVHWSLAVIVNPGLAGSKAADEDDAFSCIAVLDPLGSYHRKKAIFRYLRTFLQMEWENSQGLPGDEEVEAVSEYEVDRVLTVDAKTPMQENSYDCGVYVLKFAEVMLQNCLDLGLLAQNGGVIGKDVTDDFKALITSSAFSAEDITATRKQIQQFVVADADAYQEVKKEKAKAPKT